MMTLAFTCFFQALSWSAINPSFVLAWLPLLDVIHNTLLFSSRFQHRAYTSLYFMIHLYTVMYTVDTVPTAKFTMEYHLNKMTSL